MKPLNKEIASVTVSAKKISWDSYRKVLITGLQDLENIERKAIFFRFWRSMSIEQVAAELKVTWVSADQIIGRSLEKLQRHFAEEGMRASPFYESRKP